MKPHSLAIFEVDLNVGEIVTFGVTVTVTYVFIQENSPYKVCSFIEMLKRPLTKFEISL